MEYIFSGNSDTLSTNPILTMHVSNDVITFLTNKNIVKIIFSGGYFAKYSIADKSFLLSKDPEGLSVTLWSDHSFS